MDKNSMGVMAVGAVIVALLYGIPDQADARKWKPSSKAKAMDYLQIEHDRGESGNVLVLWMAPEGLDNTPNLKAARESTKLYLHFVTLHIKTTSLGQLEFPTHEDVTLRTEKGEIQNPLSEDDFPPLVIATKAMLQAIFRKSFGKMGQGVRVYIFESRGIDSCEPGGFWITFAGEEYRYDTPIPGCE